VVWSDVNTRMAVVREVATGPDWGERMSFDLYFGGCKDGQKASFPRERLDRHFGAYVSHRAPQCLTLDFGDEGTSYLYCSDEEYIDFFSINRPASAICLFEAILDLLRSESLVLFMPGQCPPLVGSAATVSHVPADMVEANGSPVVVTSAAEIVQCIRQA
jgi:hypothetical protein